MEIKVRESSDININVEQSKPNIVVRQGGDVDLTVASSQIRVIPQRIQNIPFRFTQTVVEGANVIRCTAEEYPSYSPYDGKTWYVVVDGNNVMQYLYLGSDLVYPSQSVNVELSLAVTGPKVVEFGDVAATSTLAYSVKADGEYIVPNSLEINGVAVTPRQSSGTITVQCNNLGVNTFILQAVVGSKTMTAAAEVNSVLPVFYGMMTEDSSLKDALEDLHKVVLESAGGFYEIDNGVEDKHVVVAVPEGFELNDVCAYGVTIPCEVTDDDSLNIGGYDRVYKMHVSVNGIIPMAFKIELK